MKNESSSNPSPESRVHPICRRCYGRQPNQREPYVLEMPHCAHFHKCCYCGGAADDGIFYRDVIKPTEHCKCIADAKPRTSPMARDSHYNHDGRLLAGDNYYEQEQLWWRIDDDNFRGQR